MIQLLNYDEKLLGNIVEINSIEKKFNNFDENIELKLSILDNFKKIDSLKTSIFPENKAISMELKRISKVLNLNIDVKKLGKNWSGDLILESNGFIKKIPIEFRKENITC